MSTVFDSVRVNIPKRNVFDLSHEVKMSMRMAELVPFFCQEVVPGDTFRMNAEMFVRLAPLLSPVMHNINCYTHFFFVPNRLVWKNWETFITGGESGLATPILPFMGTANFGESSLGDYLGFPVDVGIPRASALPFRAYQLIFNEYYRDQNLIPAVTVSKEDGQDTVTSRNVQKRCWEKDYFTSALPWPQKGGEVKIPMGGEAPLLYKNGIQMVKQSATGDPAVVSGFKSNVSGTQGQLYGTYTPDIPVSIDVSRTLSADLSTATSVTINELRRATQLQVWLEHNARGGSRYIEQIMSHFGVKSSDARLQRPEYLGGGKTPIRISEVLQTSETTDTSVTGQMSGHGVASGNSHSFRSFFEEHGIVIGIMSVLPRTAYQQGIPRFFSKLDKFDFFFPEFAHLGEQEVKVGEIYATGAGATDDATFGYQSRYAEYKYIPSRVAGEFRSSLDFWHMGRKFSSKPSLNQEFVQANPTTRIFAIETGGEEPETQLYTQIYVNLQAIRPMPIFGTPQL
ncbi:hypothetical protein EZS27_024395 [termite gut metagenome]|uniref:Major capsid protein n=1 Tax=termite gut metagenome TaxID=433724 RepID=A0A5J4QXG9_9ZZZZ